MQFQDGFSDIPPGKLGAIVINLEMFEQPPLRNVVNEPWTLREVKLADLAWYRDLFRRVGEPYLWMSRLCMNDDELARIFHNSDVELFALVVDGRDEGILELDFRQPNECELGFFGVTDALVGTTAARYMMNYAIERAWSRPIKRFWVHTCTLDHPKAIPFYLRSGFVPFKYQVEILDDPRVLGILPREAAPHIPIVASDRTDAALQ